MTEHEKNILMEDAIDLSRYCKDGKLFSSLMMSAALNPRFFYEPTKDINEIQPYVDTFNEKIWPELKQKNAEEQSCKNFQFKLQNFTLLSKVLCGRIMISINKNKCDDYVSFVGAEDEAPYDKVAIQGIIGTKDTIVEMISCIVENWDVYEYNVYKENLHII